MTLVTTTEAASRLGISTKTFFTRYVKTGILKQHGMPGNNGKWYDSEAVETLRDKEREDPDA